MKRIRRLSKHKISQLEDVWVIHCVVGDRGWHLKRVEAIVASTCWHPYSIRQELLKHRLWIAQEEGWLKGMDSLLLVGMSYQEVETLAALSYFIHYTKHKEDKGIKGQWWRICNQHRRARVPVYAAR